MLPDLASRQRDLIGGFRIMGVVDQTWQVDANSGSQGPMIGRETFGTETSTRSSALSNFRDFCCHRGVGFCIQASMGSWKDDFGGVSLTVFWGQCISSVWSVRLYDWSRESASTLILEMLISWLQIYFCMMMRDSHPCGIAWTLRNNASGTQVSFQI